MKPGNKNAVISFVATATASEFAVDFVAVASIKLFAVGDFDTTIIAD